jgi:hypothetical protein
MVANRRRSGFSSGVVASITTTISTFLCNVNACFYLVRHRFLLAWKRQNAREKGYTPSRATTLPTRMGGATQIGSKRKFQIKLRHGLTSSRVLTTFAVHAR